MVHIKMLASLLLLGGTLAVELDPDFERLWTAIVQDKIEIIHEGISWAEGPVWSEKHKKLFFTSPLDNGLYSLTWDNEFEELIDNPGRPDKQKEEWGFENGPNGLAINPLDEDVLFMNQHGARAMSTYNIKEGTLTEVVNEWNGLRFNSPNDMIVEGQYLYFTDPPYGFLENDRESVGHSLMDLDTRSRGRHKNEMFTKDGQVIRGVFRADLADDPPSVQMLLDNLQRPNGIGIDPMYKRLYVVESCQANQCFQEGRVHVYENSRKKAANDVFPKGVLKPLKTITFKSDLENGICDGMTFVPPNLGPYAFVACWGLAVINYETMEFVDFYDVGFRVSNVAMKQSHPQALYLTGAGKVGRIILDDVYLPEQKLTSCKAVHKAYRRDPAGKDLCNGTAGCEARVVAKKFKMGCRKLNCFSLLDERECNFAAHCKAVYSRGREKVFHRCKKDGDFRDGK